MRRSFFSACAVVVTASILSGGVCNAQSLGALVTAYGTSIAVPIGWSFVNIGGPQTYFQMLNLRGSNPSFQENVSLTIIEGVAGKSVAQLRADQVVEMKRVLSKLTFIGKPQEGKNEFSHVFTHEFDGKIFKAKQVVKISAGKAYVITCTALDYDYDKASISFSGIIDSFRILAK